MGFEKCWGIIELMGRQQICGELSEDVVAGVTMIRVDVPNVGNAEGYTRRFTHQAIYGIVAPITEEQALTFITHYNPSPVQSTLKALKARDEAGLLTQGDEFEDLE